CARECLATERFGNPQRAVAERFDPPGGGRSFLGRHCVEEIPDTEFSDLHAGALRGRSMTATEPGQQLLPACRCPVPRIAARVSQAEDPWISVTAPSTKRSAAKCARSSTSTGQAKTVRATAAMTS